MQEDFATRIQKETWRHSLPELEKFKDKLAKNFVKAIKTALKLKTTKSILRVGLDIHGVIDKYPQIFSVLSRSLARSGHEVYIITGQKITDELKEVLKKLKIVWTEIYSITDYNEKRGVKVKYKGPNNPWMDPRAWNSAKARICKEYNIDFHIDDSDVYGKWFKKLKVKTIYIQIKNV